MYIPSPRILSHSASPRRPESSPDEPQSWITTTTTNALSHALDVRRDPLLSIRSSPASKINVQIGIAVGITLTAFIIGISVFLYMYRDSIRFSYRKRRMHRQKSAGGGGGGGNSISSASSKSSKRSVDGAPHSDGGLGPA